MSTGGPKVIDDMGSLLSSNEESDEYGYWKRSGKMVVIDALLKLWKKQKHKVLLFTQSRQVLNHVISYASLNSNCECCFLLISSGSEGIAIIYFKLVNCMHCCMSSHVASTIVG